MHLILAEKVWPAKGVKHQLAARCQICGKGRATGMNVSHSNRRTKRIFAVNLQKATISTEAGPRQIRVCTRCLRTLSKATA